MHLMTVDSVFPLLINLAVTGCRNMKRNAGFTFRVSGRIDFSVERSCKKLALMASFSQ
jgi:hypothetical protein